MIMIDQHKVKLELWSNEIESIIEELERVPHNVFEFMNYEILVDKLKTALERDSISTNRIINSQDSLNVKPRITNKESSTLISGARPDIHTQNKDLMDKDYAKDKLSEQGGSDAKR